MLTTGYIKTKSGTAFHRETGKLYVFDDNSVSVLRGWPVMRAWKKTSVKHPDWIGCRPTLNRLMTELRSTGERLENYRRVIEAGQLELPLEFRFRNEGNPYGSDICRWYFETTPQEIRDLLRPFSRSRWTLMSFLAAGGIPARELLQSAPALAFMLANNHVFHTPKVSRPLRAVRTWLRPGKKRKSLAAWLGFPATESAVRLLAKIPRQDISIYLLLRLRTVLQQPEAAKLLRHQTVIDRAALSFLDAEIQDMLTVNLLAELRMGLLTGLTSPQMRRVAHDPVLLEREKSILPAVWKKTEQPVWLLARDTARMFRQLHEDRPLPKVPDLAALAKLHDSLAGDLCRKPYKNAVFTPPLPGNDAIIPITDYAMLRDEGIQQHNCAASYARRILDGKSALYRVLAPERCTLELIPQNGKWVPGQLLAVCNRLPQAAVQDAVLKWLDEVQR